LLNHILRENTILVENVEYTRKEQKVDMQMKAKDVQLAKLQEQIKFRDEVIA